MFQLSDKEFEALRVFVREKAGWEIEPESKSLMELRLDRYKQSFGLDSSIGSLLDAMTVQETYFFREPNAFLALGEIMTREFRQKPMKVLSAACSTGQEPYTIAMKSLEMGGIVQVDALDLSPSALAKAKEGFYQALEVGRGISRDVLQTYFDEEEKGWRVKQEVKNQVQFFQHNLLEPIPHRFSYFDVVFVRNALIYFASDARRRAMANLLKSLKEGGYLFLSATENAFGFERWLQQVQIAGVSVYRRTANPVD